MKEPIVIRPRVMPDPEVAQLLEQKLAAVVPPPNVQLHRDVVQPRLDDMPVRRQAG